MWGIKGRSLPSSNSHSTNHLQRFLDSKTLLLALVFCVCAVIGKLVAGLAAGRQLDRFRIGIGMVPRGEVGLVFLGAA